MSLLQYLTHYAEPECSCKAPSGTYGHVVVIPAFDEVPSMLDGFRSLAHFESEQLPAKRILWLIVVNASVDASPGAKARTRYLLKALKENSQALSTGIFLQQHSIGDLVLVDRCSEGRELPTNEGVGLARKIGCDIALAWHGSGTIDSPWLHCTDADVVLPVDYFSAATEAISDKKTVALTYPFWHDTEPASTFGRSLEIYELSLRYYQLGLKWANSPYAFYCIGSTMAIRCSAYQSVRGMPKRQAGEDFYLLNKVAKLGRVITPECTPIHIAQRESSRTPFGTGPATQKIHEDLRNGIPFRVYHPNSFALLREWISALDEFAETCDYSVLDRLSHSILKKALPLETEKRLREAKTQCKTTEARKRRLHTWFDGFRTLKLIHALRDHGLDNEPWQEAFDAAPFIPMPEEGKTLRETMAAQ